MLGVLRKQNLQQVAAVVTRYFGGIKLGAGGLVRAYAGSVSRAVEEAGLAQKVRMGLYVFSCEPGEAGKITNLLYQQQMFTLTDADYGTRVNFTLRMPEALKGQAEAWLTDALQRQTELTEAGWELGSVAGSGGCLRGRDWRVRYIRSRQCGQCGRNKAAGSPGRTVLSSRCRTEFYQRRA